MPVCKFQSLSPLSMVSPVPKRPAVPPIVRRHQEGNSQNFLSNAKEKPKSHVIILRNTQTKHRKF